MHAIITSVTSLPETHTLVLLGVGLILAALFLRRIISALEYTVHPQSKSGNATEQPPAK